MEHMDTAVACPVQTLNELYRSYPEVNLTQAATNMLFDNEKGSDGTTANISSQMGKCMIKSQVI